jgi:hypothetical protein
MDVIRFLNCRRWPRAVLHALQRGKTKLEEPYRVNEPSGYLVHSDCLDNFFLETGDPLVIDNRISRYDAIDDLSVEIWQVEPVLRIMRGKGLLAGKRRFCRGWPEDLNVVGVLGHEALKVVRIVGLELALDWLCWIHRLLTFSRGRAL